MDFLGPFSPRRDEFVCKAGHALEDVITLESLGSFQTQFLLPSIIYRLFLFACFLN